MTIGNRLTKGTVRVGALSSNGNVSVASGGLLLTSSLSPASIAGDVIGNQKIVCSPTHGFTCASVSMCCVRIPVSAATTGEVNSGFSLPVGAIVRDVFLDVNTREQTATTKSLSVGLLSTQPAGTASGFLFQVSTASLQVVQGSMVAGSVSYGTLLTEGTAASGRFRKNHITVGTAALTISYQPDSAHTELVADIVVRYDAIG